MASGLILPLSVVGQEAVAAATQKLGQMGKATAESTTLTQRLTEKQTELAKAVRKSKEELEAFSKLSKEDKAGAVIPVVSKQATADMKAMSKLLKDINKEVSAVTDQLRQWAAVQRQIKGYSLDDALGLKNARVTLAAMGALL